MYEKNCVQLYIVRKKLYSVHSLRMRKVEKESFVLLIVHHLKKIKRQDSWFQEEFGHFSSKWFGHDEVISAVMTGHVTELPTLPVGARR